MFFRSFLYGFVVPFIIGRGSSFQEIPSQFRRKLEGQKMLFFLRPREQKMKQVVKDAPPKGMLGIFYVFFWLGN